MSVLTMVRHAQASLFTDNYDELSALGRRQAQCLGEYLVRSGIDFDDVFCGPRVRQRQTAKIAGAIGAQAGRTWPDPVVLAEFDEYDLGCLLHKLAPALAHRDAAFAALEEQYRRAEDGPHRLRSFQKMFEALTGHWASAACPSAGVEEYPAFRDRVQRGLERVMESQPPGRRVALFTSGGVIGTAVRLALDAPDRMALELSWRVHNCSLTEFVFTKGRFTLDSFNGLPHLEDAALRTYW